MLPKSTMVMSAFPTYGVFILDRDEWVQVSEHWGLQLAEERARETHAVLGTRVRVRSSNGIVHIEIAEQHALTISNRCIPHANREMVNHRGRMIRE